MFFILSLFSGCLYSMLEQEYESSRLGFCEYDNDFDFKLFIYSLLLQDVIIDYENVYNTYYQNKMKQSHNHTIMDLTFCYLKEKSTTSSDKMTLFLDKLNTMFTNQKDLLLLQDQSLLEDSNFKEASFKNKIRMIFSYFVEYIASEYTRLNFKKEIAMEIYFENVKDIRILKNDNSMETVHYSHFSKIQTVYQRYITLLAGYKDNEKYLFLYIPCEYIWLVIKEKTVEETNEIFKKYKKEITCNEENGKKIFEEIRQKIVEKLKDEYLKTLYDFFNILKREYIHGTGIDFLIILQSDRGKWLFDFFMNESFEYKEVEEIYIYSYDLLLTSFHKKSFSLSKPTAILIYRLY